MREEILLNIDSPQQLEKLYWTNKPSFKVAFNALYPQLENNPLAEGWYQRLNYRYEEPFWGNAQERVVVLVASLLAALVAQLPAMLSLDKEFFYLRNAGFIVFPLLIAYFGWKNKISAKTGVWLAVLILLATAFINLLPQRSSSNTLLLSCIHLPLWLWSLLGFTFDGGKWRGGVNWLGFLRYNGELAVVIALLLLSGGLMTGLTLGLFELSGWHIETFYFNYVVVCGLAAVPIVATFLTQVQPALVNKVSPVIANLFSPVALVMLIVYLAATVFSGKDPYHDREFLLLYNALLIGVMALIFFSVSGTTPVNRNSTQILILFLLSLVTIVVNGIALSAVLFRIAEWGITPNRAAVLGANVLMLSHLLYVGVRLFGAITRKTDLSLVGTSMAFFLPVYSGWSALVTFVFPLLFGFK
ncbi:hypothetical protein [Spirosoma utsteinense]|uniref:DUF4153 domain-containing protein n=1 Tax=Spirosoma utsteinense TaxID=2585773 RepID=A0ABR6WCJ7_9BACT|nr:hypothetical protein [Spirosoma utsteinense]MBC3788364.1 hypothetical protein [Spirosoma utsteinense]MBC3794281.1 hypothetical protein [Spirosoma utsteinense]